MFRLCLALTLALSPLAAAAQAQPDRAADPSLDAVPADSFAFVSVKFSKLWNLPEAKPLRDWAATQQKDGVLDALFGVPLADLDRVTFVTPTLDGRGDDREPFLVATTRQKYADAAVLKALSAGFGEGTQLELTGRAVKMPRGIGPFRTAILANDRTLVFSPSELDENGVKAVLARIAPRKADGPLADALKLAPAHDVVAGLNLKPLEPLAEMLAKNEEVAPYVVLVKAKTVTLSGDIGKTAKGKVVLTFPDAETAKKAAKALEDGAKLVATQLEREADRGSSQPMEKFVLGRMLHVLKNAKVTVDGANVVATADVPYADELATLAAALPKSLKAEYLDNTAINNLKQLGIAMHNFHDTMGRLPGDVGAGQKPPAMSWRVQILPFVEQEKLYNRLDMTKAWDDPANLKVLEAAEMPSVFEHPGRKAPKGHTYYRIFTMPKNAKGTDRPLFTEGERGPTIAQISAADGSSLTFMIVEAGEAVPWYKPDVLAYDGKLPLPQLGAKDADQFLAALCDGSVRKLKPSKLGEKGIRALITPSGGEVVPDLDK